MEAFQVYTRIRPLNDKQRHYGCAVSQFDNSTIVVGEGEGRETQFQVDSVFGEDIQNQQIFESAILSLCDNFLSGINSTVFAYGITGAGKSFTMFGRGAEDNREAGLIQLVLEYLCEQSQELGANLKLSYMQIYNEQVFDLLKIRSQNLQILDDPISGVTVSDLDQVEVENSRMAQNLINLGNQRRVIAQTKANQFSSRSHAIVQISMQRQIEGTIYSAKFSLVDLAGSEKQSVYSDSRGIRNFQGSNINRSLLTLGNCINILSQRKKGAFIPYRDSKLTRLLKDSLGGNTKTAMIACVSPSLLTYDETLNTMKYACRARKIQKNIHLNVKQPRNIDEMRKEIVKLKKDMQTMRQNEQHKRCGMPREQMQELIHKLISNVETLTTIRCHGSSLLEDRMKEIDLIEEQRNIVHDILGKDEEPITHIKMKNKPKCADECQTQQTVQPRKRANTLNNKQLRSLGQLQDRALQPLSNFDYGIGEQRESLQLTPPRKNKQYIKNNSLVRSNLQTIRLQYKQNRKLLKQLIESYQEYCMSGQSLECWLERAMQSMNSSSFNIDFLSVDDLNILQKMKLGHLLDHQQLARYNIHENKLSTHRNGNESFSQQNRVSSCSEVRRQNPSRFMSSLQQIRRMMRKISNLNNSTEPNQQYDPNAALYNEDEGALEYHNQC